MMTDGFFRLYTTKTEYFYEDLTFKNMFFQGYVSNILSWNGAWFASSLKAPLTKVSLKPIDNFNTYSLLFKQSVNFESM